MSLLEMSAATDGLSQDAWGRLNLACREQQVILDNAGAGIAFMRSRCIVRCNQRFVEIYGFGSTLKAVGCSTESLYPDHAAFLALGEEAYPVMQSGKPFKTEVQMRRKDGRLFWTHLTGTLVSPGDPEGGSIWIIDDIDEQKHARAQLETVLAEQNLVLANCMVGIVYLQDRTVTRCNESFEQTFGYATGELKGKSSRAWYQNDTDWLAAGHACYEPLNRGLTFVGEMLLCKKDGTPIHCDVRAKAIDPLQPAAGSIWIAMDITARKQAEAALLSAQADLEKQVELRTRELAETVYALERKAAEHEKSESRIQHMAHFDALTSLPNRVLLADRCTHALRVAQRNQQHVALMFLDLDNFKTINDSLGHKVGDEVLVEFAARLKSVVRDQDTVARLGGDEFILLLPETDAAGAAMVADKLLRATAPFFTVLTHELAVTPSIGVALFPEDGTDLDALSRCADAAMYQAKEGGRNGYRFFTPELQARSDRKLLLGNALRRALEQGELELHYQPQMSLITGATVGVEALLRWTHPTLGSISPAEFIPVAESTGLILPIGEWVIRTAAAQLADWLAHGVEPITMAVNLSAVQFRNPDLPKLVRRIIEDYRLPPHLIELELTEGAAMTDPASAVAVMNELHGLGIRVSIDDFGTDYSSLSFLRRFQVYKLKIDQSFTRDITIDADDKAIVGAIISMAKSLGLQTIAEGVETPGQMEYLREQGCTEMQGYYYSHPLGADQFEAFVSRPAPLQ
jgi:diguanylate cyclase (GGDEF)-like protein/PAS domain S-box-containing protein